MWIVFRYIKKNCEKYIIPVITIFEVYIYVKKHFRVLYMRFEKLNIRKIARHIYAIGVEKQGISIQNISI